MDDHGHNPRQRRGLVLGAVDALTLGKDTETQPSILLTIDGLDAHGHLTGWACVADAPTQRVALRVHDGGGPIASGLADLARPDVGAAGFGDGWSGFSLALPPEMFDGESHRLQVVGEAPDRMAITTDVTLVLPRPLRARTLAGRSPAVAVPLLLPAGSADGPAALYVPGQCIYCHQPYPRPVYHTSGWHEPEQDFTWIDGTEAVIEMLVRPPADRYRLTLQVVPNGQGGRLQTLEVFFNFFRLAFFEVPQPASLTMMLPAELFTMRKCRIVLHCRNAVTGNGAGSGDTRRLGIAVAGWCLD